MGETNQTEDKEIDIDASSSFRRRFWAYLRERYDPLELGPFYLLLAGVLLEVFRWKHDVALSTEAVGWTVVLGGMLMAFYFILRVMDEHKDFENDRVAYPERILSRGLINLDHLKVAGGEAALFLIGTSIALGWPMLAGTGGLLLYALLMLREFFLGPWLQQHLFLYGISHNIVVFLSLHWCFLGFAQVYETALPFLDPTFNMVALGLNGLFFSVEVARKIHLPEYEQVEVDSYSKVVGYRSAAALVAVVQFGSIALILGSGLPVSTTSMILHGLILVGVVAWIVRFLSNPTEEGAKNLVNPTTGAFMGYLLILIGTV